VVELQEGYTIQKSGQVPARIVGKRAIKANLGEYRGVPWHSRCRLLLGL